MPKSPHTVDLRGGDPNYKDSEALKALCENRKMLVALASRAKDVLEIRDPVGPFVVSVERLKQDFSQTSDSDAGRETTDIGATKPSRRRRR